MTPHDTIYRLITDHLLALLEAGTVPWQCPWDTSVGAPRNLVSHQPYRGINVFLLGSQRFASPWWLSFPRQVNALGGRLRAGEKVTSVVFWQPPQRPQPQAEGEEPPRHRPPLLRYYQVVNVLQCTGLTAPEPSAPAPQAPTPLAACARLVAAMPQRPALRHGYTQAFYRPGEDTVYLPDPERFESPEAYFATVYHELCHSTGHPSRLNRATLKDMVHVGDAQYSREELIAELGAALLCGVTGIAQATLPASASYLQGWLHALRTDRRMLVLAAAQAQKAADFVQGVAASA